MKKIQYILFAIAFFSLVPAKNVQAQKETTYKNGLGYSKNISTPDDKGVYTITLEAFTTGKVTVTKKSIPADIVLVLDVSGSMRYNMNSNSGTSNERLNALKTAVNNFIDIINDNDLYYVDEDGKPDKSKPREQRLGNQIAIVTYSTNANNRTNGLIPLGNSLTDNSGVTSLKTIVNGLTADGGTYAHKGMDMAYGILSPLNDTRQLRTTVFFTDGVPGLWGSWTESDNQYNNNIYAWPERQYSQRYGYYISQRVDTYNTANATINSANNIKNLANDSKGIISNVYSVSIINNPGRQTARRHGPDGSQDYCRHLWRPRSARRRSLQRQRCLEGGPLGSIRHAPHSQKPCGCRSLRRVPRAGGLCHWGGRAGGPVYQYLRHRQGENERRRDCRTREAPL